MDNPQIEIRLFHDGTYSVMARLWNPQKAFYEHPKYINLTKNVAKYHALIISKRKPSIKEIIETWVLIGT